MAKNSKRRKDKRTSRSRSAGPQGVKLTPSLLRNAATISVDHNDKTIVVVKKDILLNQLNRDGPKIEKSFDALCADDLDELSELMAQISGILFSGLKVSKTNEDELRNMAGQLLMNALNSFGASVQILRSGYRLQPGIIIRNILESVSVVLHLIQKPIDLKKLQTGKLNIPKTVNTAKKALPAFGEWYGSVTRQFSHVSGIHQSLQPIIEYSGRDDVLIFNLRSLRITIWHIYVTTELLYHDIVTEPRYWKRLSGGRFEYHPSTEERSWMDEFLHGPDKEPMVGVDRDDTSREPR